MSAFRKGDRICFFPFPRTGWGCCFFVLAFVCLTLRANAQSDALYKVWQSVNAGDLQSSAPAPQSLKAQTTIQPQAFSGYVLDATALGSVLAAAPAESRQSVRLSKALIVLPMPDGTLAQFRFVEAPVMDPALAKKFPNIKTYLGQGIEDREAVARFDITPAGFHGQVLSPNGAVYIDPYACGVSNAYASYYKRDYQRAADNFHCFTPSDSNTNSLETAFAREAISGGNLRIYRLACAATAEYTTFFGGTVEGALSGIVTAINRVDGVYESELAVRLVLVANEDQLIYTNTATDPYSNGDPMSLLTQNQSNLDATIGSGNYDIGHVFGTAGGGLAGVGVVCTPNKAWGETGVNPPIGDAFYIDYVAHEIGHQFGAHHTFNSTNSFCSNNRMASTAYEPGSGSTIMSYAGICGTDDLQPHSDPYFHSVSFEEIENFITGGAGNGCAVITNTLNQAPLVNAGAAYTIPRGTPFTLTATGSDPDGDNLTYCWEERDLGPCTSLGSGDNGSSPIFRSFTPSASPARTFPRLSDLLNNSATAGEMLPGTNRILHFRVTARDNRSGGGGVNSSDTQVTVASNAGPFQVTSPSTAVTWAGTQTVAWNVAGTADPPINAALVNILLSTNGGASFPITLASNTPNDGSETVTLPSINSKNARIRVEAVGNIFFALCRSSFTIAPPSPWIIFNSSALLLENCSGANGLIDPGETVTLAFSFKNSGTGPATNLVATLLPGNGVLNPSGSQSFGMVPASGGTSLSLPFTFTASGTCGGTIIASFQLQDGATNLGIVNVPFTLGAMTTATQAFTNVASVAIRDNTSASPYPATIAVSNLTGTVTKVTATLRGITHTFPDDIDILLVGPAGQSTMLMSDVGGGVSITNVTLTFDDAAGAALPDSTLISSGTYKPANVDNSDSFPSPAPAGPYATNLAVFNGSNPNGNWSLFVLDDGPHDVGVISAGWSISITTSNAACCSGSFVSADLGVTESVSPSIVNAGGTLTFSCLVTNLGPDTATNVHLIDTLPPNLQFASGTPSQGSATFTNGTLTCSFGDLAPGAVASAILIAETTGYGAINNSISVNTATTEFVTTNNFVSASAVINALPGISSIPDQVIAEQTQCGPLAFTVSDIETPAGALSVTALAVDTNLVPSTNFVFGGSEGNRTLEITPAPGQFGTTVVSVAVSDGLASSSTSFLLSVFPVNHSPVFQAGETNFTINEGATLVFTNSALDFDLPAQALTFTLSNAPSGASIDPLTGIFSWTPQLFQALSTNALTIIVTDDGTPSLSASQTVYVTVTQTNQARPLPMVPDQTVMETETLEVTNLLIDPSAQLLPPLFSLDPSAPSGAAINATNGLFSWTPTEAQGPSTNSITVYASYPALLVTNVVSFNVTVLESNTPPALSAIGNRIIHAGSVLVLTNNASDGDIPANNLIFSLDSGAPPGAAIDPVTGILTFPTSTADLNTTNSITVRLTDDGIPPLDASQTFTVAIVSDPWIEGVAVTNGVATITWSAIPGQPYRLEFSDDPGTGPWQDAGVVTASAATASQTNSATGPFRFYRVLVAP